MGKRLRGKFKKEARDTARTQKAGALPAKHKVSLARSKRALKRKAYPAC